MTELTHRPVPSESAETLQALQLAPADEHNLQLAANVHPANWVNPEPAGRYHLVAIGGGTAGLVSAAGAAGLGARAALIERHLLGGDCLNVGCVPSKGVIRAARAYAEIRRAPELFGAPRSDSAGAGDFGRAMERMRRLRAGISRHDSAQRFQGLGVDVFLGDGRFVVARGDRGRGQASALSPGGDRHRRPRRRAAHPRPRRRLATSPTRRSSTSPSCPAAWRSWAPARSAARWPRPSPASAARSPSSTCADHVLPREDADAAAIVQKALAG